MKFRILIESEQSGVLIDKEVDGFTVILYERKPWEWEATPEEETESHLGKRVDLVHHSRGVNELEKISAMRWMVRRLEAEFDDASSEGERLND